MVTKGTCGRKQLKSEEGISQVPSKGHLLTFPEFSRQPPAAWRPGEEDISYSSHKSVKLLFRQCVSVEGWKSICRKGVQK